MTSTKGNPGDRKEIKEAASTAYREVSVFRGRTRGREHPSQSGGGGRENVRKAVVRRGW